MIANEIKSFMSFLNNAVEIRIVDDDTKHIIDGYPIEKVSYRKSYNKNGVKYTFLLQEQDKCFMYTNGKIKKDDEIGFNIPKDTYVIIEVIDEKSNVLFLKRVGYYNEAGTLAIKRKMTVEVTS